MKQAVTDAFEHDPDVVRSNRERRIERLEQQTARTVNKGHGRIEQRTLTSTAALNEYLDWPGVQQFFRLERRRTSKGKHTTEIAYGITSLVRTQADAAALLAFVRGHWSIENNLFGVRDTAFGKDVCRVRIAHAPQNLAAIRNVAITLLNRINCSNKAATLRRHAAHPQETIALIRGSPENETALHCGNLRGCPGFQTGCAGKRPLHENRACCRVSKSAALLPRQWHTLENPIHPLTAAGAEH